MIGQQLGVGVANVAVQPQKVCVQMKELLVQEVTLNPNHALELSSSLENMKITQAYADPPH